MQKSLRLYLPFPSLLPNFRLLMTRVIFEGQDCWGFHLLCIFTLPHCLKFYTKPGFAIKRRKTKRRNPVEAPTHHTAHHQSLSPVVLQQLTLEKHTSSFELYSFSS